MVSLSRGSVHSVVLLHIYFLGGPFTLRAMIFESLVWFRPLGGPSTLWTCHIFFPLEGSSTLMTKILEPLVRSRALRGPSTLRTKILEPLVRFRPLGGPSTLWTCHNFYPLESSSTLRTNILEPLVWFRPLEGPCTLWSCYIFTF